MRYKITIQLTLDVIAPDKEIALDLVHRWKGASILTLKQGVGWLNKLIEVVKIEEV